MDPRLICIILNIIFLLMEAYALTLTWPGNGVRTLIYYTQLSNLTAALSSLLLLITGPSGWVSALRYLGVCMLVMTFFVTAFVLVPLLGDPKMLLFSGSGIFLHLFCPIICLISYLFFEQHAGRAAVILPVAVTFIYGLIMLYMNAKERVDGPYPFFKVKKQSVKATVIWFTVLFIAIGCFSLGVWALGEIC